VAAPLHLGDTLLLSRDQRLPLDDAAVGFLQQLSYVWHRRLPVEAVSNFSQKVVGKAQPMTIVLHKVEGQERKYIDNNANGTHSSVCGLNYFSTSNPA
jgi:hypothetical protein